MLSTAKKLCYFDKENKLTLLIVTLNLNIRICYVVEKNPFGNPVSKSRYTDAKSIMYYKLCKVLKTF